MNFLDILQTFIQNIKDTGIAEYFAVVTGVLSVWFAKRENILVYPVGIVSVLIYVYLCYFAGLYADMGINGFYFLMSVYGWYNWTRKDKVTQKIIPISFCSKRMNLVFILLTMVFFVIIYYLLTKYTNSTVPWLDSFTTAIFIIGMWLMALKKTENWIYWIIGDLICIFLFAYKGLVLSGFQYLVFLVIAIAGLREWWAKSVNSDDE